MKVWAYEIIDWDLLRDDTLGAMGISPRVAYPTMERAKEVAEADWGERTREEHGHDPDWEPLKWEVDETFNGNMKAEPYGAESVTYRIYYIEIEGAPRDED